MLRQEQQNINKPKSILLQTTTIGSLYTLPRGKRFKGYIHVSTGSSITFAINGKTSSYFSIANTATGFGSIQIELFEGDTLAITQTAGGSNLLGVEYDA